MASFADLPEDLIEYIMLHLSPYGELQTCKLICKQWNRLATGAMERLRRLFLRCSAFDWFLLQPAENQKFVTTIAERCSHASCYHSSGSVFVFGGCTAAYTTFNDLWKFNLATRSWIRPVPMGTYPTPKACSTMVEYRGNLILFGGWSKSSPNPIHQTSNFYNELHVYDPATNFWIQIADDGMAPHLAGHSATIVGDRMVVFGGSHGTVSSNQVWVFDMPSRQWFTPSTSTPKPLPRYGQSQILIDSCNILITGGCGGPNLIFSDAWLLTIRDDGNAWQWQEITVLNPQLSAPQLWSHPACKVGADKLVVLSKQPRATITVSGNATSNANANAHRLMSTSHRANVDGAAMVRARGTWVPPQGNLIPPRRKLISSRSLDEDNPSPSPKSSVEKKTSELQRAHSIPAIIVGEIPKLVVTEDTNESANAASTSSNATDETAAYNRNWPSPCITMVASSLLPNATSVETSPPGASTHNSDMYGAAASPTTSKGQKATARLGGGPPTTKDRRNREKQLEVLRRMEEYIRSRSHHQEFNNGNGNNGNKMKFRPSSPPPKPKYHRPSSFHPSKNPMCVYVLDLSKVLTEKTVQWSVLDANYDAPEDTILYSLVQGRGELILFGGMRSSNPTDNQGLDVMPSTHMITSETYILKPPIMF